MSDRIQRTKSIYLINNYRKYTDVKAIRIRDENNLLAKMLNSIKTNIFFGWWEKNGW